MTAPSWTMPAISDEQRARVEEKLHCRQVLLRTRERLKMVKSAALVHKLDAFVRWN